MLHLILNGDCLQSTQKKRFKASVMRLFYLNSSIKEAEGYSMASEQVQIIRLTLNHYTVKWSKIIHKVTERGLTYLLF